MNELSLSSDALADLHTGMAECFDGYKMPSMNFGGAQAVADVGQKLEATAHGLSYNMG